MCVGMRKAFYVKTLTARKAHATAPERWPSKAGGAAVGGQGLRPGHGVGNRRAGQLASQAEA